MARIFSRRLPIALAFNSSIEDVAALFFSHHDACRGKLLQMAGYDRPVLWLALRNGSNVGPAQQYNLLQHCNARGLAQRLEEACVEHGNALLRRLLATSSSKHSVSNRISPPFPGRGD